MHVLTNDQTQIQIEVDAPLKINHSVLLLVLPHDRCYHRNVTITYLLPYMSHIISDTGEKIEFCQMVVIQQWIQGQRNVKQTQHNTCKDKISQIKLPHISNAYKILKCFLTPKVVVLQQKTVNQKVKSPEPRSCKNILFYRIIRLRT